MEYKIERMAQRLLKAREMAISDSRKKSGATKHPTQEAVAKKCGVSRATVVKWEQGIAFPTSEQLTVLCDLYDCDIGYLFCEYDEPTRTRQDITEITCLSSESAQALEKYKGTPWCILFLEDLLSEPQVFHDIALAYDGYKEALSRNNSFERNPGISTESGYQQQWKLKYDADTNIGIAQFMFNKAMLQLAEKHSKNKKEG